MVPIWRGEVDYYSRLIELCRMSGYLRSFLPLSPGRSSVSLDNLSLSLWASNSSSINEEAELKYKILYTCYFCVAVNQFISIEHQVLFNL